LIAANGGIYFRDEQFLGFARQLQPQYA
jgi:hypothetical protein